MINYIKNEKDGGYDYPNKNFKKRSALGLIKMLCHENLFTLEGYLKTVKKQLDLGNKVPIFINFNLIFFYTKDLNNYENIFINYSEIKDVKEISEAIEITFQNNEIIKVDISRNQYKRLVMTIFRLYKYKESLV